ncbi:hypothetical protein ACWCW7_29785 [Nocardia tengchongensis]
MIAHIARKAAFAAVAAPVLLLAAPTAAAEQPAAPITDGPVASRVDRSGRTNADAPYIHITICVHIPTPGSATLDWCWP